jgi:hypothetical protein
LISYHLILGPLSVNIITKKFAFLNWLIRHYFYSMKPNDVFMTYAEVQKTLETLMPVKEEKVKK